MPQPSRGFGGTSGAAPKVAGTVALMLEANPQLTHEEIRDTLRQKGSPLADDAASSFLDTEAAVKEALRLAQPASITPPLVEAATVGSASLST